MRVNDPDSLLEAFTPHPNQLSPILVVVINDLHTSSTDINPSCHRRSSSFSFYVFGVPSRQLSAIQAHFRGVATTAANGFPKSLVCLKIFPKILSSLDL